MIVHNDEEGVSHVMLHLAHRPSHSPSGYYVSPFFTREMTLSCTSLNFLEFAVTVVVEEELSESWERAVFLGALDSTDEPNTGVKDMCQAGLCVFSPK